MKVAVNPLYQILIPRFAAIVGVEHVGCELPEALIVVWVDADLAVVHRPRIYVAHLAPGLATIVRTKGPTLQIFNQRINDIWIPSINVEADAAGNAFRQTFIQLVPGSPAINGLVDGAARPTAVESPGCASSLVSGGVKSHWTIRIHRQINHARVFVDEEHIVPGLAPVSRLVNTALFVWPPQMTEHSRVDNVWITRVDDYAADMSGIAQPHVLPGLASVQ